MKGAVVLEHFVGHVGQCRFDLHHVNQAAGFCIRRKARGQSRYRAFNDLPSAVKLVNSRLIEGGNNQATTRMGRQETFAFESPQTFTRRCAADLQPVGDHVLRDTVARFHLVSPDGFQHGLISHITEQYGRSILFWHRKYCLMVMP